MTPRFKIYIVMLLIFCACTLAAGEFESDGKGTLDIRVLCGHNLFSKDVAIWRGSNSLMTIPQTVLGHNASLIFNLNHNGRYDNRVDPGNYNIYLYDGNGGQPEFRTTTVYSGYQSVVSFIGHAVTMPHYNNVAPINPRPTPTPVPTITPCIPNPLWHDGYWETERQWKCNNPYTEGLISCCDWQNVPVWHDGYYEDANHCEA
jgi:hypothetical protein